MKLAAVAISFIACAAHVEVDDSLTKHDVEELPLRQACFVEGFGTVFGEFHFSCAAMECNREVALRILTLRGIIASREEFVSTFGHTPILLRNVDRLYTFQFEDPGYEIDKDRWVAGRLHVSKDGRGYIELERSGWPLLHELLHVYEYKHGRRGHVDWESRGYEDAVREYVEKMKLPTSTTGCRK